MLTRREFIQHLAVAFVSVRVKPPRKPRTPPVPTTPAWVQPGWADPLLFA